MQYDYDQKYLKHHSNMRYDYDQKYLKHHYKQNTSLLWLLPITAAIMGIVMYMSW